MADFEFIDHTDEVKDKTEEAILIALEACGIQCQSHAIKNLKSKMTTSGTGRLAKSITHEVDREEKCAIIGSNVEYAIYNEFGTGRYAADGSGRKTPWVYVDDEGVGHKTHGMKPKHFLRDALMNHREEYKGIFKKYLSLLK